MSTTPERVKPSEAFRERALVRYRAIILKLVAPSPADEPDPTDTSQGHVPLPSKDSALTAFAQLAALRLDASRALISLIDSKHQYILAESTGSLSLQHDGRRNSSNPLWLGAVSIARSKGICGLALESALQISAPTHAGGEREKDSSDITVIGDLKEDPRTSNTSFVVSGPRLRFYAGVPIRTSDGTILGILCVFDDKARTGLSEEQEYVLRDLSTTIMHHLDALRINYAHARTNKLVTGLESFVDGLASTRTAKEAADNRIPNMPETGDRLAAHDVATEEPNPLSKTIGSNEPKSPDPSPQSSLPQHLWDLAMPAGSKPMFARAANVMRQSGDYDGCAIFYVSSGRKTRSSRNNLRPGHTQSNSEDIDLSHTDSSSSPERNGGASDTDEGIHVDKLSQRSICPLLSYSLAPDHRSKGSPNPFPRFKKRDLERLLGKSPRPRSYTLTKAGEVLPGDTSSSSSGFDHSDSSNVPGGKTWEEGAASIQTKLLLQQVKALKKIDSHALSYVCLPLWDFERQRWLAHCVCWTKSPSRHLKYDGDVGYLRVFGNCIAVALSHIDAIASNRSKGTFVSCISHELRSPLHGILSATNFLRDGNMSRFELEMIGVISSCGRTLLDTLDHVMDFAKISSLAPKNHLRTTNGTLMNRGPRTSDRDLGYSMSSNVNLASLIEEVVEAVLMGYSVQHDFLYAEDDEAGSTMNSTSISSTAPALPRSRSMVNTRGRIRLVLEIPHRENWHVYTQAGAWRRIIMNLFGNSLKYTNSGLILVRAIPSSDSPGSSLSIRLCILDTGKGIAKYYLDTRLFKAFSQEDQLSSGTGLGLAIVKQVVDSLDGDIDLQSVQGQGTTISVGLTVPIAEAVPSLSDTSEVGGDLLERLRGRHVYILEDISPEMSQAQHTAQDAERQLLEALSSTLKEWFGIEVSSGATWPNSDPDLVILLKPWLKYFEKTASDNIFRQPILLITYDALEMAVLRTDARISRDDAVIEVTSQPLGPYKLARMLRQCLDRYDQLLFTNSRPVSTGLSFGKSPSNLSLVRSATPRDRVSPVPAESRRKSTENFLDPFVLIVDDNPLNLRLLSVFIQRQSLKYHEAVNGQEAVDIFRIAKKSVRCILMDISMPVLDGIAATRLIREYEQQEKLSRTPIVALTGLTSAASRSEAEEAGMDDFLTKPISFSQLGSILEKITGL